jgi:hypothetical protein
MTNHEMNAIAATTIPTNMICVPPISAVDVCMLMNICQSSGERKRQEDEMTRTGQVE